MDLKNLARGFQALFKGLARAHGKYVQGKPVAGKKTGGIATTEAGEATVELWLEHLEGKNGVGVVPIMDGDVCRFAALDVDLYDLDHVKVASEITNLQLPLVPCRTKSGGLHLYVFANEDIKAELIHARMMEWAVLLGFAGCEVFPKQIRLASTRDIGNWINMPYHGGANSLRYAMDAQGRAITPEEFLALAEVRKVAAIDLVDWHPPADTVDQTLADGPPCLQTLARRGFPDGMRNTSLYNLCVYLKKRYPDNWETYVDTVNDRYMDPKLGHKEVGNVTKSVAKKNYAYQCNQQPLSSCCNRQLCLTRQFGVGGGPEDAGVMFGALQKLELEPPLWILTINGMNVELQTEELMDQTRCHRRIVEAINIWPNKMKVTAWRKLIQDKLDNAEILKTPDDAKEEGQVRFYLNEFCTRQAKGTRIEDILRGVAYTDVSEGRTYFRGPDFINYLKRHYKNLPEREAYNHLREMGVRHLFEKVNGKGVNYWSVDWKKEDEQTEEFQPAIVPGQEM